MTPLDGLKVDATDAGAQFSVRLVPGARREGVASLHGGALKVSVREPPEKGRANAALVDLLSKALALRPSELQIISGQGTRNKRVRARGLAPDEVRKRLSDALFSN